MQKVVEKVKPTTANWEGVLKKLSLCQNERGGAFGVYNDRENV